MNSLIRKPARALRWMPQRLLHPLRSRRVARGLSAGEAPQALLFICHGNICRSPFAQELLLSRLPPPLCYQLRVLSAGFIGANRPSPPDALRTALRFGVDLTGHRSRVLAPEGIADADWVIVMDELQQRAICRRFGRSEEHVVVLGDLDPEPIERRGIQDPVEQSEAIFLESYARIERCIDILLDLLVASWNEAGKGPARTLARRSS